MSTPGQVSTSYPRVPMIHFYPVMDILLSGYRHFPFILLTTSAYATYIDCIQIPVYVPHVLQNMLCQEFQFFLYTTTFTFFAGRGKTVYTYQFLSSPCQLIIPFPKLSTTRYTDAFPKCITPFKNHCFHINIFY